MPRPILHAFALLLLALPCRGELGARARKALGDARLSAHVVDHLRELASSEPQDQAGGGIEGLEVDAQGLAGYLALHREEAVADETVRRSLGVEGVAALEAVHAASERLAGIRERFDLKDPASLDALFERLDRRGAGDDPGPGVGKRGGGAEAPPLEKLAAVREPENSVPTPAPLAETRSAWTPVRKFALFTSALLLLELSIGYAFLHNASVIYISLDSPAHLDAALSHYSALFSHLPPDSFHFIRSWLDLPAGGVPFLIHYTANFELGRYLIEGAAWGAVLGFAPIVPVALLSRSAIRNTRPNGFSPVREPSWLRKLYAGSAALWLAGAVLNTADRLVLGGVLDYLPWSGVTADGLVFSAMLSIGDILIYLGKYGVYAGLAANLAWALACVLREAPATLKQASDAEPDA